MSPHECRDGATGRTVDRTVTLETTADEEARLGRHAGLHRAAWNWGIDLVRAETHTAALARRRIPYDDRYGVPVEALQPWTPTELVAAWRAAQPAAMPWAAHLGLSTEIPETALTELAVWYRAHYRRGGPYPHYLTHRAGVGGRFCYRTGAVPLHNNLVCLDGFAGPLATCGPAPLGEAMQAATVQEHITCGQPRWTVTFTIIPAGAAGACEVRVRTLVPAAETPDWQNTHQPPRELMPA